MNEPADWRAAAAAVAGALAEPGAGPTGGAAAALAGAHAAALVTLVARVSREWSGGPALAREAELLTSRLLELAEADAAAWVAAHRHPEDGPARRQSRAVPEAIRLACAEVDELAQQAARGAALHVHADARVACELAGAAQRAAAAVVGAQPPPLD